MSRGVSYAELQEMIPKIEHHLVRKDSSTWMQRIIAGLRNTPLMSIIDRLLMIGNR
jgi:hypothetical protein